MIAFYVPMGVAKKLKLEVLEESEQKEQLSDLHLTFCMLGEANIWENKKDLIYNVLDNWASSVAPLSGKISGVGLFNNGDQHPLYASVDCAELPELRDNLLNALQSIGVEYDDPHGYTPHITLGWFEPNKELEITNLKNIPIKFNKISISWAGDIKHFELKGAK